MMDAYGKAMKAKMMEKGSDMAPEKGMLSEGKEEMMDGGDDVEVKAAIFDEILALLDSKEGLKSRLMKVAKPMEMESEESED